MNVTIEKLAELHACSSGVEMFQKQFGKEAELKDLIRWAIGQEIRAMRYANLLIVQVMTREQYLSCAIIAARKVLAIFESKYPNLAIEATEACILNDSKKNARAAYAESCSAAYASAYASSSAASSVAYAASSAAYAAYAYAAYAAYSAYPAYPAIKAMMAKILEYGLRLFDTKKGGGK